MPNDYPLSELEQSVHKVMGKGGKAYFKWTCEACGERVTSEQPNVLSYLWRHDDCPVRPGYVSDVTHTGGNLMVVWAFGSATPEDLTEILGG